MASNFSSRVRFDGKTILATIVPQLRKDGMYYEVNVKGYPRFYMHWSALDRYDIVKQDGQQLPYNLILAVSDAIEAHAVNH
jgi:hypothetical protein